MKGTLLKILVFVLLLGLFSALGGFVLPHGFFNKPLFSKHSPFIPWVFTIVAFVYGAAIAVWGDKTVGVIHPVSFRSGYIILGALLMIRPLLLASCLNHG